jgi:hypothetical protein
MKTAELRDKMVARVQETFAANRTFLTVPEAKPGDYAITIKVKGPEEFNYVQALHEFFAVDPDRAELAGRYQDTLVGGIKSA